MLLNELQRQQATIEAQAARSKELEARVAEVDGLHRD
jgi:hypothetical protein